MRQRMVDLPADRERQGHARHVRHGPLEPALVASRGLHAHPTKGMEVHPVDHVWCAEWGILPLSRDGRGRRSEPQPGQHDLGAAQQRAMPSRQGGLLQDISSRIPLERTDSDDTEHARMHV